MVCDCWRAAQPSWNTIGRESYLMLGSGSCLGSTALLGGAGGASLEALTPRGIGHGSSAALAAPDSPMHRRAKAAVGGAGGGAPADAPADASARG
jgi:hypothetical protein